MSSRLRTIRRVEPRILDAKGIAGTVAEMRFTWKRRSKKPGPRETDNERLERMAYSDHPWAALEAVRPVVVTP